MRAMSFSAWERRYKPYEATEIGGEGDEGTWIVPHAIAATYPPEQVWTVVTGDNGRDEYLSPGFRIVNRVGYIVCRERHDFPVRDAIYWRR